jgi:NAD(P)-dependent dehydrogenase (short-subunit alcohol dehydrogenase family)
MTIDLKGTRAIVTGSTAGIGFAIARRLAESGAEVVINGRSRERMEQALAELRQRVPQAVFVGVAADLGSAEGVEGFIREAGEADILVNNLGIYESKGFRAVTDDEWRCHFDTNVMSGVRLSRHYLPCMVKKGWGRLVFISSGAAFNIAAGYLPYSMTKSVQLALSRGLAESVAGSGVTVNAVLPGPTRTQASVNNVDRLAKKRGISPEEAEKQFFAENPLMSLIRRLLDPEEVADMVVYVCSKEASATTGAVLRVDGGMVRGVL